MALQFCDGCDSYGSVGDVTGKWSGYRFSASSDLAYLPAGGRFGGGALRFAATSGMLLRTLGPAVDEIFLWAAILPRAYPTANASFLWFEDAAGASAALRMTASGALFGTPMGSTTALTPTSAQAMTLGAWNTLAVHYKCADSGGRWRVVLNGADQITFTGDTRSGSAGPAIDRVVIGCARGGAGAEWDWDDIIICDTSGPHLNALITTDVKIETLRPVADGPGTGWTPSAGADRYALVGNAAPDEAAFLAATIGGARALFSLADPPSEPQTTHALVVNVLGRRTDVGPRSLRPLVRVAAAEDQAADLALSSHVSTLQHPVYRNPDGAGPWTGTALNLTQIGMELV